MIWSLLSFHYHNQRKWYISISPIPLVENNSICMQKKRILKRSYNISLLWFQPHLVPLVFWNNLFETCCPHLCIKRRVVSCRGLKQLNKNRNKKKKKKKGRKEEDEEDDKKGRDRFAYPVCLSRLSVHCRRYASCRADSSYLHSARENLYKRSWASDELDDWRAWRLLPCLTLLDCLPSYLVTTCHRGWHEGHGERSYDA